MDDEARQYTQQQRKWDLSQQIVLSRDSREPRPDLVSSVNDVREKPLSLQRQGGDQVAAVMPSLTISFSKPPHKVNLLLSQ